MTEEVKTKDDGPFERYLRYEIYGTLVTGVMWVGVEQANSLQ